MDDDGNLRLFALRRAAEASNVSNSYEDNNRVVVTVQATPDRGCPMHGRHGSYQLPQHQQHHYYQQERPSRKEMARELRMSAAREEAAAKAARSSSYSVERTFSLAGNGGGGGAAVRSYSLEYNNSGYHSMPRRMSGAPGKRSSAAVDRRGSFGSNIGGSSSGKSTPRDVFKGKLDFKTILRRFDPKEEERSNTSYNNHYNHSRSSTTPRRDYDDDFYFSGGHNSGRRRGSIVDSDFDFRGGSVTEPNWDNPGRFRFVSSPSNSRPTSPRPQSQPPPTRQLRIDIEGANSNSNSNANNNNSATSPTRNVTSNPVSPRRVGFGEQTVFDFDPRAVRSAVTSPVPTDHPVKPILRHTTPTRHPHQQQRPASPPHPDPA